ncbi:MAG TPA: PIN domain-containing protein [Thermoleophilaceae bacterium]|nr:PIN domain-containing protein [Thermoleophilaceae bacterium]
MSRALLDTSVFIAEEQGRPLARPLPEEVAVSVVTLAELETGVLMARDDDSRAARMQTLLSVRERAAGIPADQRVASAYARLASAALKNGKKPRVQDTWIAATAAVHNAEVWTQDDDFTEFATVEVVRV